VELGSQRVVDINDNDLPVGLLLVNQGHNTQNLDLLDLTRVADQLTNLADVERIVVTLGLGLGVDRVGVLPGLVGLTCQLPLFLHCMLHGMVTRALTRGKAP
jgi:hypothetical protein